MVFEELDSSRLTLWKLNSSSFVLYYEYFKTLTLDKFTPLHEILEVLLFLKNNNLDKLNTSNVSTLRYAFYDTSKIADITALADWNVSNVTTMYYMFCNCKFSDISTLANWNVSNITTMQNMFLNCSNLTNLSALANWNTSNVTDMYQMFCKCINLTDITALANWNTSNVTTMQSTFNMNGVSNPQLTDITALANWNVSNVTNMYGMFAGCTNLTTLDMSGWDTGEVSDANGFLASCSKLTTWKVNYLLVFIMCLLGNCLFLKCNASQQKL